MTPDNIYSALMAALSDEKIKGEITAVLSDKCTPDVIEGQTGFFPEDSDTTVLSAENQTLKRKVAMLELEIGRMKGEYASLLSRNESCRMSLNTYCGAFGTQIAMYEKYKKLTEPVRRTLDGIFKNNTLAGLFYCGVQYDNLNGLRTYTEQLVINEYAQFADDIRILTDLWTYLLGCYNSTFSEKMYEVTTCRRGDVFDENIHHSLNGKKIGRLAEVRLQGVYCPKTSKTIRKAFVNVTE